MFDEGFFLKVLKELVQSTGISGFEDEVRNTLERLVAPYVSAVRYDRFGNLIAEIGPSSERTLVFAAHMDEIGFVVQYIDDSGFLRFYPVGGVDSRILPASRVQVMTEKGRIPGVIGFKPPHIQRMEGEEKIEAVPYQKLFVDVGASSREEVEQMGIKVGDPITFEKRLVQLGGSKISGTSLDDRVGCALLVALAKELSGEELRSAVRVVFTLSEEYGLIGAHALGEAATFFVAVDSATTGDHPEVLPQLGVVKLGKGPVLRLVDAKGISHPKLRDLVLRAAKREGLKLQVAVLGGTTDATAQMLKGVPSTAVCFPIRYTHSPAEVVSLKDVESTFKLLKAMALEFS